MNLPATHTLLRPVARKAHKCCECNVPIAKGDTYEKYTGCWEGKWDEFKTCQHCVDLRAEVLELYDTGEVCFGELKGYSEVYDRIVAREVDYLARNQPTESPTHDHHPSRYLSRTN